MDAVDRLVAIEEIKRLKASYCRFMDTKDWANFARCFTPDAIFDHGGEGGAVQGPDEIAAFVRSVVGDVQLVHHALMPEVDVISETSATAIWGLDDRLRWPDGRRTLHAFGHYHETYDKVDGQWRIASSRVSQLRVDTELVAGSDWQLPGPV